MCIYPQKLYFKDISCTKKVHTHSLRVMLKRNQIKSIPGLNWADFVAFDLIWSSLIFTEEFRKSQVSFF